ncbi:MAG: SprT family zinc-dependent metalloprotease [Pseudomonadota bacterium]
MNFFRKIQRRDRDFSIEIDRQTLSVKVNENERARRLTLRILPDGSGLKITTPDHVSDHEISAFVDRNRNWVAARMKRMPDTIYVTTGAMVPYLGQEYRIEKSGRLRGVVEPSMTDENPVLLVPGDDKTIGRKLLSWFKQEARRELNLAVSRHSQSLDVRPKQLRITDTTSRWGSCSTTRTLSFSWRIIMAPPEVLDYLAAHEVAHLREMNHSARFWSLVKDICPEMEKHKAWLKQNGTRLHTVQFSL